MDLSFLVWRRDASAGTNAVCKRTGDSRALRYRLRKTEGARYAFTAMCSGAEGPVTAAWRAV
jgi:hypothetical protein